jgi:aspartate-semialdehyde dehydrogenase
MADKKRVAIIGATGVVGAVRRIAEVMFRP